MEGRSFDDVTRMLGRAGGRRALLIGLGALAAARLAGLGRDTGAGPGSLADAPPAAAKKKKKKKCKPACVNGYTCVKISRRKRECQCLAPGTACGDYCCPEGQTCSGGACVSPASPTPSPSPTPTATGTAIAPTPTSAPPTATSAPPPTSVPPTPTLPIPTAPPGP